MPPASRGQVCWLPPLDPGQAEHYHTWYRGRLAHTLLCSLADHPKWGLQPRRYEPCLFLVHTYHRGELAMRTLLPLCLLCVLPWPAIAQSKKVEPVKIIKIDRKDPIAYEKEIEPIFYKRCVACHSGTIKESKFDVGSYESVMKGGQSGSPVVPGKSEKSKLYHMLTRVDRPFMPPRSEEPVTPEELAMVKLWIDQGARAPKGPSIINTKIIVGLPPTEVHPVRALAVSPDNSTVAAGRGNRIDVYDAKSGTHIRSLIAPGLKTHAGQEVKAAHLSIVEAMAFSPDGKYLASGSFQEVNVWDVSTGALRQKLTGFAHNVMALAFTHDNKILATGGGAPTQEGEIRFFEVGTWRQIGAVKNGHSDTVYGLCFSPDGKLIASGSADKFVKIFEVPTGKFVKSFEGHTHHVLDVGWQADGKLLASAGADNTVKIWNYAKGEQERTIAAAGKQLTRLQFIGKRPEFVTCSGDAQVRFFNASNGGNVRNFGGNTDFLYAIGVSPDGKVVAAGGEEGVVRVYNGDSGQLVRSLLPPGVQAASAKKS